MPVVLPEPPPRLERGFPHLAGHLEVLATSRPTPRLVRLVLGGEAVAAFPDEEPGEILTLIWRPDGGEVVLPSSPGWSVPAGTPEHHSRNFTVREVLPDRSAVVVDVVLHEHLGLGARWAAEARTGDRVAFAGPRLHFYTEPGAAWTLLAGDETALPAIAATLERLPAGHRVLAFVEVADAAEEQEIACDADADVTWLHRDGTPAHRSTLLLDALRAAELPEGPAKVWVAGEGLVVRGLREHLRDERGLPIGLLQAIGYWRHRTTPDDVDAT